jgi:hypothetical protein
MTDGLAQLTIPVSLEYVSKTSSVPRDMCKWLLIIRMFEHQQYDGELRKKSRRSLKSIVAKNDSRLSVDLSEANERLPIFTANDAVDFVTV